MKRKPSYLAPCTVTTPRWIEVLCHDINVHVPHHVSVGVPSYNLRQAHAALKRSLGATDEGNTLLP